MKDDTFKLLLESWEDTWGDVTVNVEGVKLSVNMYAYGDNPNIGISAVVRFDENNLKKLLKIGIWSEEAFEAYLKNEDVNLQLCSFSKELRGKDDVDYYKAIDVQDVFEKKLFAILDKKYTAVEFIKLLKKWGDYKDWKVMSAEAKKQVISMLSDKKLMGEVMSLSKKELLKLARNKEVSKETEDLIKTYMKAKKKDRMSAIDDIMTAHESE